MKEFLLNQNTGSQYSLFSYVHLIILLITYLLVIFILLNKNKLTNISDKQKNRIRKLVGFLLLFIIVIRRGSFIYYGVYNWKKHLDLGFCNMTNLIFIVYCFTGNKKIYNICYYFIFCGPLLAMLFPSVTVSINNFSFLAFIIMHYGIFIFNLVFAIFENKKYKIKEAIIGIGAGIVYFLMTNIFNLIFNTSYNRFDSLVSNVLYNNEIIKFLNSHYILNILLLIIIGSLMSCSGIYVLKILNIGVDKLEKK